MAADYFVAWVRLDKEWYIIGTSIMLPYALDQMTAYEPPGTYRVVSKVVLPYGRHPQYGQSDLEQVEWPQWDGRVWGPESQVF